MNERVRYVLIQTSFSSGVLVSTCQKLHIDWRLDLSEP